MKLFQKPKIYTTLIRAYSSSTRNLIVKTTEVSSDHLTPEIQLHLITPRCKLWYSKGDDLPYPDPFWAFYWPGGQSLTRYILDNRNIFKQKNVVDIGSGCGASAIACKLAGARTVIANDIDEVATEAIRLNSTLNEVGIQISSEDLIGHVNLDWDVVLLGDMFYDSQFANIISKWIPDLFKSGISVYIGDPGRLPLMEHPLKGNLELLSKYELPKNCLKENHGMDTGYVWRYFGH